mmetsp:Transcript_33219/g.61720  ORF Transcript_33219/g.61720 Transcript_33219/m.61720 type:complete len:218 (-) Transcript_33219:150-803(-)
MTVDALLSACSWGVPRGLEIKNAANNMPSTFIVASTCSTRSLEFTTNPSNHTSEKQVATRVTKMTMKVEIIKTSVPFERWEYIIPALTALDCSSESVCLRIVDTYHRIVHRPGMWTSNKLDDWAMNCKSCGCSAAARRLTTISTVKYTLNAFQGFFQYQVKTDSGRHVVTIFATRQIVMAIRLLSSPVVRFSHFPEAEDSSRALRRKDTGTHATITQ